MIKTNLFVIYKTSFVEFYRTIMVANIPPLHLLQAFDQVAKELSFSKAAENLNVTRSTISHRIQLLEKHFNLKLFERTTRSIKLSTAGAAYYLYIKDALLILENLADIKSGTQKKVVVSTPPTFANFYIFPALKEFIEKYPDIEISIEITKSQLNYETSDVDFDVRYGTDHYHSMITRQITYDLVIPVCSPNYLYEKNIKKVTDIKNGMFLRSYLEPWKPWLSSANLMIDEPSKGHRFEDLSLLYRAAENDLGIALARPSLIKKQLEESKLVRLFDISAVPKFQYYAILNPQKKLSSSAEVFLDWLCKINF